VPTDISTKTHSMSIKDLREKKCKDKEVDLTNRLERNLHTIPGIVNGLIQEWNNKVNPMKLDTSSRDCANLNAMLEEGFSTNSILGTGDSHSRGCSARLKNKLNKAFRVMGKMKPGLVINTLPSVTKSNMDKLTANDAIAGTNDVSHNYSHD